ENARHNALQMASRLKLGKPKPRAAAPATGVMLAGADLRSQDLTRHDLRRATLAGVDLRGTRLIGTDLTDADLTDADLRGARLVDANLTGANCSRPHPGTTPPVSGTSPPARTGRPSPATPPGSPASPSPPKATLCSRPHPQTTPSGSGTPPRPTPSPRCWLCRTRGAWYCSRTAPTSWRATPATYSGGPSNSAASHPANWTATTSRSAAANGSTGVSAGSNRTPSHRYAAQRERPPAARQRVRLAHIAAGTAPSRRAVITAIWSRIRLTETSHCRLKPGRRSNPDQIGCRASSTRAPGS